MRNVPSSASVVLPEMSLTPGRRRYSRRPRPAALPRHRLEEHLHRIGADLAARAVEIAVEGMCGPWEAEEIVRRTQAFQAGTQPFALPEPHELIASAVDEQGGRAFPLGQQDA